MIKKVGIAQGGNNEEKVLGVQNLMTHADVIIFGFGFWYFQRALQYHLSLISDHKTAGLNGISNPRF